MQDEYGKGFKCGKEHIQAWGYKPMKLWCLHHRVVTGRTPRVETGDGEKMVDKKKEDVRFNTTETALKILKMRGLDLPDKPKNDTPVMPYDITKLDNEELSRLLSSFSAWLGYAESRVALADVERTVAHNKMEQKKLEHIEVLRKMDKRSVYKEVEAKADVHKDVLTAAKEMVELESVYELTKGVAKSFERCVFACSREQSRREGAMRAEGRSYSSSRTGDRW